MSDLRPLRDKLLVRPLPEHPEKTAGGIFIPATARHEGNYRGVVLSVGDGYRCPNPKCRYNHPMDVRPGDTIHYARHATKNPREVDGETVHLIRYEHVMAVEE